LRGDGLSRAQKLAAKAPSGSLTSVGAVAKQAQKPLAGASTPAGALARVVNKAAAGSATGAGALQKVAAKALAGALVTVAGPNLPATATNAGAGFDWADTSGAFTPGDDFFSSTGILASGENTKQLRLTGFGFALPATARVVGVLVTAYRYDGSTPGLQDLVAQLVLSGSLIGTNSARVGDWGPLPEGAPEPVTYGGLTDTLGATLTGADVNDSSFGFALSATCTDAEGNPQIDGVSITVYYTPAAGALTNQTAKALAGSAQPAGALVKSAAKPLAGSETPAGALAKHYSLTTL
jgi:hypothetical protein